MIKHNILLGFLLGSVALLAPFQATADDFLHCSEEWLKEYDSCLALGFSKEDCHISACVASHLCLQIPDCECYGPGGCSKPTPTSSPTPSPTVKSPKGDDVKNFWETTKWIEVLKY